MGMLQMVHDDIMKVVLPKLVTKLQTGLVSQPHTFCLSTEHVQMLIVLQCCQGEGGGAYSTTCRHACTFLISKGPLVMESVSYLVIIDGDSTHPCQDTVAA